MRLCHAKADAHEKHLQVSFSAPMHDIFRDYKRFLSLYIYHLLSKFAYSLDLEDLRLLAKPNLGQTGIPRINHVSERPTLRPIPRKNIIEP